jgi:hypothetical protein
MDRADLLQLARQQRHGGAADAKPLGHLILGGQNGHFVGFQPIDSLEQPTR